MTHGLHAGACALLVGALILLPFAGCRKTEKPPESKAPPAATKQPSDASLSQAVSRNDRAAIDKLLQEGADINIGGNRGPLIAAVRTGRTDLVEYLISKGALVNAASPRSSFLSPLSVAVGLRDAAMVKLLLDHGADANVKDADGDTLLAGATGSSTPEIVDMLIARGADVNGKNTWGITPLMVAARDGTIAQAQLLVSKGARLNDKDAKGWSALDYAILRKYGVLSWTLESQSAKSGLSLSAELDRLDALEAQPVPEPSAADLLKVYQDYREARMLVGFLMESGAQLDVYSAAALRNADALAKLLEADAALARAVGRDGLTALHCALLDPHASPDPRPVIELLLAKSANANARGANGDTPLFAAVKFGRKDLAELLISKGAPIDQPASRGRTPLRLAASQGRTELAEFLISKGAALNLMDDNGDTPLTIAVKKNQKEIVELLASHGADVNAVDYHNASPLSVAVKNDRKDIIETLKQHGALMPPDALVLAVSKNDREKVSRLLSQNMDIEGKDSAGCTPLVMAVQSGLYDMTGNLMDRGADLNAPDSAGNTPLSVALKTNQPNIARMLKQAGAKE